MLAEAMRLRGIAVAQKDHHTAAYADGVVAMLCTRLAELERRDNRFN
jgi:hypothetical protein